MAFLKSLGGKTPCTTEAAFVAETAALIGDITLGRDASVWYGAVLRADTGRIVVGSGTNVQDNAVLHTGTHEDVVVGDNVTIGHSALVHGCTVKDGALIGMHATVLNRAVIGAGAVVAAGTLVTEGMVVPDGMLAIGVPAKIHGPVRPEVASANQVNTAGYVTMAKRHAAETSR